jgi:hypothetical protein
MAHEKEEVGNGDNEIKSDEDVVIVGGKKAFTDVDLH